MNTMLRRVGLCLALLLPLLLPAPARADQSTLCLPTSGTVSGLTIVTGVNAALKALVTSASGTTEPTNDCSGAPIAGQVWLDTNASPNTWKLFDGTSWLPLGRVDTATHSWLAPVGGGASSLASAATTDLWSIPQSYITVTGTTAITKLAGTGAVIGTIKYVAFAGALTLTQNATQLILPTGANITTAVGDRAAVVALGGGNVAVLSYERANGRALSNPVVTGDTGSGGAAGLVPAPAAGSAAANLVLGAGGAFMPGVPVATVVDYAGLTAPGGWLFTYGQCVSRTTYAALFSALGTLYGSCDGSTTFGIPDTRGRVIAGQDDMGGASANRLTDSISGGLNGDVLGDRGGEEYHQLTIDEMPRHRFQVGPYDHRHGANGDSSSPNWSDGDSGGGSHTANTNYLGDDDPHNNVQPTLILNKIIRF